MALRYVKQTTAMRKARQEVIKKVSKVEEKKTKLWANHKAIAKGIIQYCLDCDWIDETCLSKTPTVVEPIWVEGLQPLD